MFIVNAISVDKLNCICFPKFVILKDNKHFPVSIFGHTRDYHSVFFFLLSMNYMFPVQEFIILSWCWSVGLKFLYNYSELKPVANPLGFSFFSFAPALQ